MTTLWESNSGAEFTLCVYCLPRSGLMEAKIFRTGLVTVSQPDGHQ